MSKLVEIAKGIGKFEAGTKEFPGMKRFFSTSISETMERDFIHN